MESTAAAAFFVDIAGTGVKPPVHTDSKENRPRKSRGRFCRGLQKRRP